MKQLTQALAFLAEQHTGNDQTGRPFITHPIQVLNELVRADITDESVLIAGLLHDIRIYTSTTEAQITSQFGQKVAELINELYYDPSTPKPELQFQLLDRQVELSDEAQQVVLADIIANTSDGFYDEEGTELMHRARGAFVRALVDETPEPHQALHQRFKEVMTDFCTRNNFNQDESYWGFVDEDDRLQHIFRLEREVAELRGELEAEDVTE